MQITAVLDPSFCIEKENMNIVTSAKLSKLLLVIDKSGMINYNEL